MAALFYRYATVAGVEYVADVLIGPHGTEPLATRPGDSGTLWVLDKGGGVGRRARPVEPLAMQWGGHVMVTDGVRRESPYALATFISNVCRSLDVELVTDWNTGHDRYWGEVGHYTIGARACDLVTPAKLRDFFVANRSNISFDLDAIAKGEFHTKTGTLFYPLADVPDRVWKKKEHGFVRAHEGPNHFADMDQPDPNGDTLLSLYGKDPATLTPNRWISYYQAIGSTPRNMGMLPFRVAQLYKLIVDSLQSSEPDALERALCAGGVMAHYVGDACQPLHISRFHDGRVEAETGVHEDYETAMVGARRKKIIDGLASRLRNPAPLPPVQSHQEAGHAVVALMERTVGRLSPETICETWVDTGGRVGPMWDTLGTKTIACMADGCKTLAMLWASAWKQAGTPMPAARAADHDALKSLYMEPNFAPSLYLTEYSAAGIW